MSSKTFLTISKNECKTVYLDILENSNQKWEAGKKLAEINDYGSAISLAIISVEELIKSLIVFLDGKGFDFRGVQGINTVFRHHKIRYVIAYAMFVMGVFGDELIKFILKIKNDPEKFIQMAEAAKKDDDYFEKKYIYYLFKKFVVLRKELDWFSKADIFRQDGFYCDYQDDLKNPIKINSEEYKQVLERLDKVRNIGLGIINACNSEEEVYTTHLAEMKANFIQKGFYLNMANALARVNQSKGNPFDLIKSSFDLNK